MVCGGRLEGAAAACDGMVDDQHDDGADNGDEHAVVDLLRFSGEALGQVRAIFSNCAGLVKSSAEWRRMGL